MIALHIVIRDLTAVSIVDHITKILGNAYGILTVEVDIRLSQPALHMRHADVAALGLAIKNEGVDQLVRGHIVRQRINQLSTGAQITGAAVVHQRNNGIILPLLKGHIVSIEEAVHIPFKSNQNLTHFKICFFPGHGVFRIILHHVVRTFCAIANGVTVTILIGLAGEAFVILDKGNTFFTRLHV